MFIQLARQVMGRNLLKASSRELVSLLSPTPLFQKANSNSTVFDLILQKKIPASIVYEDDKVILSPPFPHLFPGFCGFSEIIQIDAISKEDKLTALAPLCRATTACRLLPVFETQRGSGGLSSLASLDGIIWINSPISCYCLPHLVSGVQRHIAPGACPYLADSQSQGEALNDRKCKIACKGEAKPALAKKFGLHGRVSITLFISFSLCLSHFDTRAHSSDLHYLRA